MLDAIAVVEVMAKLGCNCRLNLSLLEAEVIEFDGGELSLMELVGLIELEGLQLQFVMSLGMRQSDCRKARGRDATRREEVAAHKGWGLPQPDFRFAYAKPCTEYDCRASQPQ